MQDVELRGWLGAWLLGLCLVATAQAAPKVGDRAPDSLGTTPDGEEIRISAHRGKAMVVSFWASWCGYCRKQFPVLDFLQTAGGDQLRVVVVNFQEPVHDYRNVRRALRKSPVTWTHDRDGRLSELYGVASVPHMFIIDKTGRIAAIRRGYSEDALPRTIELINGILAKPVPADTPVPGGETSTHAQEART